MAKKKTPRKDCTIREDENHVLYAYNVIGGCDKLCIDGVSVFMTPRKVAKLRDFLTAWLKTQPAKKTKKVK